MKKSQIIEKSNKISNEKNSDKQKKHNQIKRICFLFGIALSVYIIIFWTFFYIIIIRRPKYTIKYNSVLSDDTYKLYYENKKTNIKYYTNCYNKIMIYEDRLFHKKESGELKKFIEQGKLNKLLKQSISKKVYYNNGLQTEYNFEEEDTNILIYRCANNEKNVYYLISSMGNNTFYECNKSISNN